MSFMQTEARPQVSFFVHALATHMSDPREQAEPCIAKVLKEIIAEASALYAEMKCLHWYFSRKGSWDEHRWFDTQARQLFAATDRLLRRARYISGTAIGTSRENRPWQLIAIDRDNSFLTLELMQRLIKDHKYLAWLIREAIAVCEKHQDAHTCQILREVLVETAYRTSALVEVQHRLNAEARAVEQE